MEMVENHSRRGMVVDYKIKVVVELDNTENNNVQWEKLQ